MNHVCRALAAALFLATFVYSQSQQALPPESVRALEGYAWPGNVRELQHVIERASILAEGAPILPQHLGLEGNSSPQLFSSTHFA